MQGRLLVYQVVDTKLHLGLAPQLACTLRACRRGASLPPTLRAVHERETRGAVYSCIGFQGRLLCGINSRVQMYRLVHTGPRAVRDVRGQGVPRSTWGAVQVDAADAPRWRGAFTCARVQPCWACACTLSRRTR